MQPRNLSISVDQDWNYAFWAMEGTRAVDLTGATLELVIRPKFNHATLIRKLSSAGGGAEIIIDNAVKGAAHILVPQATVMANLPVSPAPNGWSQFLRVIRAGGAVTELWRGALFVNAGKTT